MDVELKTEFLFDGIIMRAWREDDVDAALEIVIRNREHLQTYMRWMTPDYSVKNAKTFIVDSIKNRLDNKTLGLALLHDGKLIGSTGFNRLDWAAHVCEIGYWIDHEEEGKGIITRACQHMIDYAIDELDMNRIEIRCSAENIRSAAIPNRLGFKHEGLLRQAEMLNSRPHDLCVFGLLAEDPRLW